MYTNEVLYFKATIILVDDDHDFLSVLVEKLSKKFIVKAFNDPVKAMDYIQDVKSIYDIISPGAVTDNEDFEYGEHHLSLEKIQKIANDNQKKSMPIVIIADYVMPSINGIELFEKITDTPIMKILLTANADLDLALYAFNRGIVDKFLVKNSAKILNDVDEAIHSCQHGFFKKQSYPIINSLHLPEDSLLHRFDYLKELEKVIREHDAVEYYLIDSIGSYLLITATGSKFYYICMIDRQFSEYLEIAVTSRAPTEMIKKLNERTHAPIFISEQDYKLPTKDWPNITHAFEKKNDYYFCLLAKK